MPDRKEIVIKDSCILFDLVDLNLLEIFFRLAVTAITTPQVIAEITDEGQWQEVSAFVDKGYLVIDNNGAFEDILNLNDEYPGLSTADSSVLELALRKDAIIFSSDGLLRKISRKKELTVRGILWIIEQLHSQAFINKLMAIEKLETYAAINKRAPKTEIEKLIEKLKTNSL